MNETAKRDQIANRIADLCAQMEAEGEADTDEEAAALVDRNTARMDEAYVLMDDLAARRVRNKRDLVRRSRALLSYLNCAYHGDEGVSPVTITLDRIIKYAQRSGTEKLSTAAAACIASLVL